MITPNREFYFLRHAQTDASFNVLRKVDAGDIPLNDAGITQAEIIEPLIGSLPIKTICCSPMKRAKQTKDICCRSLNQVSEYELNELSECDSKIWQEMTSLGPKAAFFSNEPILSYMQRVRVGINKALSKEGPVLIVSHAGIFWAMSCLMQIDNDWKIDNCSLVEFSYFFGRYQANKLM